MSPELVDTHFLYSEKDQSCRRCWSILLGLIFKIQLQKSCINMDVSENSGTTKSSILIGFTIINHPFWGTPIFGNTHMAMSWVPVLWWKGYPGIFSPHTNTAIKELLGDDGEQMARAAMKAGFLRGEWNGMLIVRSSPRFKCWKMVKNPQIPVFLIASSQIYEFISKRRERSLPNVKRVNI